MIRIGGSGDRNESGLQMPAENDLGSSFSMGICDLKNRLISEMLFGMSAPAKRISAFDDNAVWLHIFLQFSVLVIQMVLVLNHSRHNDRKGQYFIDLFPGIVI